MSMNWFVFILFFISGACGLIYEVVWSRMMFLIFGRSSLDQTVRRGLLAINDKSYLEKTH